MKKYNEFLKGVYNKENREDFRTHSRKKYIIKKLILAGILLILL